MARRSTKKTSASDPLAAAAAVLQTVVALVVDPDPPDALPPADFVPEAAPADGPKLDPLPPRRKARVRKSAPRRKRSA